MSQPKTQGSPSSTEEKPSRYRFEFTLKKEDGSESHIWTRLANPLTRREILEAVDRLLQDVEAD